MSPVDAFVVAHDHARTLRSTLASLAGQTQPPGRTVVVDNASTDGSVAVVEELARTLPLELHRFHENRGFAAAANDALRRTQAEWILALNPDCRLAPDYLAQLVAAVSGRERVARR